MNKNENPWNAITVDDYIAHMDHPDVDQIRVLNEIMKEQFLLIPERCRSESIAAVLGITHGNGVEHAEALSIGTTLGLDINAEFIEACKRRFAYMGDRFQGYLVDLITEKDTASEYLKDADLIVADLLIEHVHLDNVVELLKMLPPKRRIFTCVIQHNLDGQVASKSGHEHVFDDVIPLVENVSVDEVVSGMASIGYANTGCFEYPLRNNKLFLRLDFAV